MSKATELTAIANALNARGYAQVDAVYRIAEYVKKHGMLNDKGKIARGSEDRAAFVAALLEQAEWYTEKTVNNYIAKSLKVLGDSRFKPGATEDKDVKRNTDVCWELTRDDTKPPKKPKPRKWQFNEQEQQIVTALEKAWENGARMQAIVDYLRANYDVR